MLEVVVVGVGVGVGVVVSLGGGGGGEPESAPLIGTTEMGFSSAVGALGAVVVPVVVPVPVPLTWGFETAGSVSGAPMTVFPTPSLIPLKFDCDRGARLPTAPKTAAFTCASRADADFDSGSGPGSGCTVTTGDPVSASFDTSTVGCAKEVVGGGRGTRAACCVSASVVCVEWAVGSLLLSRSRSIWAEGRVDVVSVSLVVSAVVEKEKSYGEREEVGEAHRILYHLRPLARDPLTREHRPCPLPSPVDSSRYRAASCYGRPGPRVLVPNKTARNKTNQHLQPNRNGEQTDIPRQQPRPGGTAPRSARRGRPSPARPRARGGTAAPSRRAARGRRR